MWRRRAPRRTTPSMRLSTPSSRSPADGRGERQMAVGALPEVTPRARTRPRPQRQRLRRPGWRTGYAYIAPFFIIFLSFSLYPWLDTAWVSLHDVRLTTYDQQTWIGLDNYREIFTSHFFWNAFW